MCGLISIYSPDMPISRQDLERGVESLHHRGPDHASTWLSSDGSVGLGHTRLSIIDLATGEQPMSDQDGQVFAVVNGELYDFERIRGELEAKGHRFKTRSDSEIALHLYKEYGTRCVEFMRGEFAVVIWDSRRKILFAARDRFGIKPLFYARRGNAIYLASEAKALLAAGVPSKWDIGSVETMGYYTRYRSIFNGIESIPPGQFMVVGDGEPHFHTYWDFDYPQAGQADDSRDEQEVIEEVRESLLEATRLRLRADVPVGVYLSGGIDSCTIMGMVAHLRGEGIDTFTLSFKDQDFDEAEAAKEMAFLNGANHHRVPINPGDLAENFAEALYHFETPVFNSSGVAKFVLSKKVREAGYKVVITGEGSDEIFGGYLPFRLDMLLNEGAGDDPAAFAERLKNTISDDPLSKKFGQSLDNLGDLSFLDRAFGIQPTWAKSMMGMGRKVMQMMHADLDFHSPFIAMAREQSVTRQLKGRNALNSSMYGWSKSFMHGYILSVMSDRAEMGHSIEGRLPFLDHKVVETVARLPAHYKIRGRTEKYILREAARPFISDSVYNRHKHPFLAPAASLDPKDKMYQLMQDTLRGSALKNQPFFDERKVISALDEACQLPAELQPTAEGNLLIVLSLCLLGERFNLTA